MPRKRIADQEPVSSEGAAAAAPAKASKRKAPEENNARAPRSSATAVTHRHKKFAAADATEITGAQAAPYQAAAIPVVEPAPAPSREDIARLAYSLWESSGYRRGSEHEDWVTAERMLSEQRTSK